MNIRALEPGDREAWTSLWTDYLAFYETVLPPEMFATTWQRLHDADEPIWGALAIGPNGPVGLTHFIFHRSGWTMAPSCYLQDLYVAPEGRGQGFGKALIEHVTTEAGKLGTARVHWLTQESNATARALYDRVAERSGFIQYRKAVG
jgi:ribosomal protein S18 acetylase RimI-like enzyme